MCIPPEHYHNYVLAISEILNSKHIIALLVWDLVLFSCWYPLFQNWMLICDSQGLVSILKQWSCHTAIAFLPNIPMLVTVVNLVPKFGQTL